MSTAILERPTQRPATTFDAMVQATATRNDARIAELRKTAQERDSAARLRAIQEWRNYGINEAGQIVKRNANGQGYGTVYGKMGFGNIFNCDCPQAKLNRAEAHELARLEKSTIYPARCKHRHCYSLFTGEAITSFDETGEWFSVALTPADIAAAIITTMNTRDYPASKDYDPDPTEDEDYDDCNPSRPVGLDMAVVF